MRPSSSSLPAGDRSPDSSPPHLPVKKRKRPSAVAAAKRTPPAASQPPPSLAKESSIQNLFSAQASAGASQSTKIDSSPNRKKPKTQPSQMQSEMYSFSTKLAGGNPQPTNTGRRLSGKLNKGFQPKTGSTKLECHLHTSSRQLLHGRAIPRCREFVPSEKSRGHLR
jgi:hypothetical protein